MACCLFGTKLLSEQIKCRFIVNWTIANKLHESSNQNTKIFTQENAFEYVVYKMASILSWPQYVNPMVSHFLAIGVTACNAIHMYG